MKILHDLNEIYDDGISFFLDTVECSYDRLVKLFGPSVGPSSDNKCACQWYIKLDNERIVNIYDWKCSKLYLGKKGLDLEDIKTWNIGGRKKEDAQIIKKIIKGEIDE